MNFLLYIMILHTSFVFIISINVYFLEKKDVRSLIVAETARLRTKYSYFNPQQLPDIYFLNLYSTKLVRFLIYNSFCMKFTMVHFDGI